MGIAIAVLGGPLFLVVLVAIAVRDGVIGRKNAVDNAFGGTVRRVAVVHLLHALGQTL